MTAGVFLDPACGSGIFLVRLFQRLCEHRRKAKRGRTTIPWSELLDLLFDGAGLGRGRRRRPRSRLPRCTSRCSKRSGRRTSASSWARGRVLPPLHGKTLNRGDFLRGRSRRCAGRRRHRQPAVVEPPRRGPFRPAVVQGRRAARAGRRAGVAVRLEGTAASARRRRRRFPPARHGLSAQPCPVDRGGAQAPDARGARLQRRQLRRPAVPVVRQGPTRRRADRLRSSAGGRPPTSSTT